MTTDEKLGNASSVASLIDHTLLRPEATLQDIAALCLDAVRFRFATVCINPYWVPFAAERLAGSSVAVCTVIGFPLGANQTRVKLAEAETALLEGARELDMVQNIGAFRSGESSRVRDEIAALASLSHSQAARLKVILETCLLNEEEKVLACQLAVEAGADFVKTSTGFAAAGATVQDVELMRHTVGDAAGVKAAGGIRTLAALREMVRAGADRIGTSAGVKIVVEMDGEQGGAAPVPLSTVRIPGGNPDTY
ncbi:MAG: deoxyribose-phosphate aldolase [Acidobacteriaceae bacterium]|nr:deoxyribose-phosphate aldolase [Acidobacteriaceae bacterium]